MAKYLLCLALVSLAVARFDAWIIRSDTPTSVSATTAEPSEACIELARRGDCNFYDCFEQRFPCGRNGYIQKQGEYYCEKIQRLRPTFNAVGQSFLNDSMRCLTTALIATYRQDSVVCHDVKHLAMDQITPCYRDNAFCRVFNSNSRQFASIYEASDLIARGAGRSDSKFTASGYECELVSSGGPDIRLRFELNFLVHVKIDLHTAQKPDRSA